MKAIDYNEIAPLSPNLTIDKWARKAGDALHTIKRVAGKMARLAHNEPNYRERHLLDQNVGPEIRRTWW